jgi:hypothetical protein
MLVKHISPAKRHELATKIARGWVSVCMMMNIEPSLIENNFQNCLPMLHQAIAFLEYLTLNDYTVDALNKGLISASFGAYVINIEELRKSIQVGKEVLDDRLFLSTHST